MENHVNPICVDENHSTCRVCMCEMQIPTRATNCTHFFCSACLDRWIQHQLSNGQAATCPICRTTMIDDSIEGEHDVDGESHSPQEQENVDQVDVPRGQRSQRLQSNNTLRTWAFLNIEWLSS